MRFATSMAHWDFVNPFVHKKVMYPIFFSTKRRRRSLFYTVNCRPTSARQVWVGTPYKDWHARGRSSKKTQVISLVWAEKVLKMKVRTIYQHESYMNGLKLSSARKTSQRSLDFKTISYPFAFSYSCTQMPVSWQAILCYHLESCYRSYRTYNSLQGDLGKNLEQFCDTLDTIA